VNQKRLKTTALDCRNLKVSFGRHYQDDFLECLPSLTFYSMWRSWVTRLSFARLRVTNHWLTWPELSYRHGEKVTDPSRPSGYEGCFHAYACKVVCLLPLRSKYRMGVCIRITLYMLVLFSLTRRPISGNASHWCWHCWRNANLRCSSEEGCHTEYLEGKWSVLRLIN